MNTPNILQAIADLGYISSSKAKSGDTATEWNELPGNIRTRIFRDSAKSSPDDIASQLEQFQVFNENDLLAYLKDPYRLQLSEHEANDYDLLLAELEACRKENIRLSEELAIAKGQLQAYERLNPYELLAASGGNARARSLSQEKRTEIARKAANARYAKQANKKVA